MGNFDSNSLEAEIGRFFDGKPGVCAVYLFGSQAKGTAKASSDVDVAILFEHESEPSALELIAMREELADVLAKDVDLVSLSSAGPIIVMQILQYGVLVTEPNAGVHHRFVMRAIVEYADFKMMRKPLEDAILSRRLYERADPAG